MMFGDLFHKSAYQEISTKLTPRCGPGEWETQMGSHLRGALSCGALCRPPCRASQGDCSPAAAPQEHSGAQDTLPCMRAEES